MNSNIESKRFHTGATRRVVLSHGLYAYVDNSTGLIVSLNTDEGGRYDTFYIANTEVCVGDKFRRTKHVQAS